MFYVITLLIITATVLVAHLIHMEVKDVGGIDE